MRRLSPARVRDGARCPRLLWWRVHEPLARELSSPAEELRRRRGMAVLELARSRAPGGLLIEFMPYFEELRVAGTKVALKESPPAIYEACFVQDDVSVTVDILQAVRGGWALVEVKASTEVSEEHLWELATQLHVLRRAGVQVARAELMYLDPSCRHPELSTLLRREDVTGRVERLLPRVPEELRALAAMLEGPLPEPPPDPRCDGARPCPFRRRCRPRAAPSSGPASAGPGLGPALDALREPLGFLELMTVSPAIPRWPGCRPLEPLAVLFSHRLEWEPQEHLALGAEDPRRPLAERLLAVCRGSGSVLVWGPVAERLVELAAALPPLAVELEALRGRVVDLSAVVREHVRPPLLPPFDEPVGPPIFLDADDAQLALERVVEGAMPEAERQALRRDLLEHAAGHTRGLAQLVAELRRLAPARQEG